MLPKTPHPPAPRNGGSYLWTPWIWRPSRRWGGVVVRRLACVPGTRSISTGAIPAEHGTAPERSQGSKVGVAGRARHHCPPRGPGGPFNPHLELDLIDREDLSVWDDETSLAEGRLFG